MGPGEGRLVVIFGEYVETADSFPVLPATAETEDTDSAASSIISYHGRLVVFVESTDDAA